MRIFSIEVIKEKVKTGNRHSDNYFCQQKLHGICKQCDWRYDFKIGVKV